MKNHRGGCSCFSCAGTTRGWKPTAFPCLPWHLLLCFSMRLPSYATAPTPSAVSGYLESKPWTVLYLEKRLTRPCLQEACGPVREPGQRSRVDQMTQYRQSPK